MVLVRHGPYSDVVQGLENWQITLNQWRAGTFDKPFPFAKYANPGALPAANANGGCGAIVEDLGQGVPAYAFSDGVRWNYYVISNYLKTNGVGSLGTLDHSQIELELAEGCDVDFHCEWNGSMANARLAMQAIDEDDAVITSAVYSCRGTVRGPAGLTAWNSGLVAYAAIGGSAGTVYNTNTEDANGRIHLVRGASNSDWFFHGQMHYDTSTPGSGSTAIFTFSGRLLVPSSKRLKGIRLFARNISTGAAEGNFDSTSRIRFQF